MGLLLSADQVEQAGRKGRKKQPRGDGCLEDDTTLPSQCPAAHTGQQVEPVFLSISREQPHGHFRLCKIRRSGQAFGSNYL